MENIIKISQKEKITTIRVSDRTKKELESFGISGDSHEEIIKKLMKMAKNSETAIIRKGNLTGTKYKRSMKTLNIETEQSRYSIVFTFNDIVNLKTEEWELDPEIVNIRVKGKWKDPKFLIEKNKQEYNLLYLVAVKKVLEEMFGIKVYEITTLDDYFDLERWRSTYKRNNLSMESFYSDVQRKLK